MLADAKELPNGALAEMTAYQGWLREEVDQRSSQAKLSIEIKNGQRKLIGAKAELEALTAQVMGQDRSANGTDWRLIHVQNGLGSALEIVFKVLSVVV